MEADSAADYDVGDVHTLLLPSGVLPPLSVTSSAAQCVQQFALAFNAQVFGAWVKQRSPDTVLAQYVALVSERRERFRATLARLLLVPFDDSAVAAMEERLLAAGLRLDALKKDTDCRPATISKCVAVLRRMAGERVLAHLAERDARNAEAHAVAEAAAAAAAAAAATGGDGQAVVVEAGAPAPAGDSADALGVPLDALFSLAQVWGLLEREAARAEVDKQAEAPLAAPPANAAPAQAAAPLGLAAPSAREIDEVDDVDDVDEDEQRELLDADSEQDEAEDAGEGRPRAASAATAGGTRTRLPAASTSGVSASRVAARPKIPPSAVARTAAAVPLSAPTPVAKPLGEVAGVLSAVASAASVAVHDQDHDHGDGDDGAGDCGGAAGGDAAVGAGAPAVPKKTKAKPAARATAGKRRTGAGAQQRSLKQLVDAALSGFLRAHIGVRKLTRVHPSTAPIGNGDIVSVVARLHETAAAAGSRDIVTCRLYMGAQARLCKVALRASDSDEVIEAQWAQLWHTFNEPRSVLLFHLTNHYALVYALREWRTLDGTPVRQVLTARRGQRPTQWIDFAECRQIMLRWNGYKMMHVQRTPAPDVVAELHELRARAAPEPAAALPSAQSAATTAEASNSGGNSTGTPAGAAAPDATGPTRVVVSIPATTTEASGAPSTVTRTSSSMSPPVSPRAPMGSLATPTGSAYDSGYDAAHHPSPAM